MDSKSSTKEAKEQARVLRNQTFVDRRHKLDDELKKTARVLVDGFAKANVTDLYLSDNLMNMKFIGTSLSKETNRKFYGIPYQKLVDHIVLLSSKHGISVTTDVNEAYTSKCSAVSGDPLAAQRAAKNHYKLPASKRLSLKPQIPLNVFNGRRSKRIFTDSTLKKQYHADSGAAANIVRVACNGYLSVDLRSYFGKIANPRKLTEIELRSLFQDPSLDVASLKSSKVKTGTWFSDRVSLAL
jgi:transposase